MKGPYPIICRGHSGSRLLCEAFRHNRIWMGLSENRQRDAEEFRQANPVVSHLVAQGFRYPELSDAGKAELQGLMRTLVDGSRDNCPAPEEMVAFGWKRAITTFTCEIFMDAYPSARTVHLIRDGRDAMLSRLHSRMGDLGNPLNRLVVFGDADRTTYRGQPVERAVEQYRNEIEMHHWVTAVTFGRRARRYGDRYLEVRYEDLCERPEQIMGLVCDFLDVPFQDEARAWLRQNASPRAIGKWKGREAELEAAIEIGAPMLKELGYIS